MVAQESSSQRSSSTSSHETYRPFRPSWLGVAIALYIVLYWFFGVLVQNINLLGPVTWISYLNQLFLTPFLPEPTSPILRFIFNLLNPLIWVHMLGPLLIGRFLARRTTEDFLRQFHAFATRQQAAGFLGRLQTASKRGPITASKGKSRQSISSMPSLLLMPAVVFFGMLAVFVVIVEITKPPVASTAQVNYIFLVAFLIALWIVLITLSLAITRDYLVRTGSGTGRLARLAGQRLFVYALIILVLVIFPALWMLAMLGLLRTDLVTAQQMFLFLTFAILATTITAVILLFLMPKAGAPLKVTREEFEQLRSEHPALRVGGPGTVFIAGSHQAAVTELNGRFSRVIGPGMQQLGAYEYIHSIQDLRQHEREGKARFVTRDGLQVEITMAVTFRIASNDAVLDESLREETVSFSPNTVTRPTTAALFPYGLEAVKMASYAKTVLDHQGSKVNEWYQLPLIFAKSQLNRHISELRYDELFAPDQPERQPHPDLASSVLRETQIALRRGQTGIHLLNVRLGAVVAIEPEITREHISTWRAFWEKQDRVRAAQGDAQAITGAADARREAEQMLFRTIISGINATEQKYGGDLTRQIVALRVVETLGRMASQSQRYGAPAGTALLHQLSELQDTLRGEVAVSNSEQNTPPPGTGSLA